MTTNKKSNDSLWKEYAATLYEELNYRLILEWLSKDFKQTQSVLWVESVWFVEEKNQNKGAGLFHFGIL